MPPRRDALYLSDIVEAGEDIRTFLAGIDQAAFLDNGLVKSAVAQKLIVIGEAAACISAALKARHPFVPWEKAKGLRNILAHAYFSISWRTVWQTAIEDVPRLADQVAEILAQEDG